jgi:hypothetical protein
MPREVVCVELAPAVVHGAPAIDGVAIDMVVNERPGCVASAGFDVVNLGDEVGVWVRVAQLGFHVTAPFAIFSAVVASEHLRVRLASVALDTGARR